MDLEGEQERRAADGDGGCTVQSSPVEVALATSRGLATGAEGSTGEHGIRI